MTHRIMLIAGTKAKLAAWKRLVTRMGSSYQVVGQSRNLRNSHRLLLGLQPDMGVGAAIASCMLIIIGAGVFPWFKFMGNDNTE